MHNMLLEKMYVSDECGAQRLIFNQLTELHTE